MFRSFHRPRRPALAAALVLPLLTGAACSRNKLLGRKQLIMVPNKQMNTLGAQSFQQIKAQERISTDAGDRAYVSCVARAITREVGGSWEVVVFDSDTINAFALPGNKIGVYTGLLDVTTNQHQLAAVLGHEVAHVLAKHGAERVTQSLVIAGGLSAASISMGNAKHKNAVMAALGLGSQVGVALPHSRKHETESDLIGQRFMAQAGFNPAEAGRLWANMKRASGGAPPEFLSTHPSSDRRIADLNANLKETRPIHLKALKRGKRPNCRR